jgi:hypothetical protein
MIGRALGGVLGVAFQNVLVNVIAVHVMQMTVVQIVGMPVVFEGDVSASRPVRVRMLFVFLVFLARHVRLLFQVAEIQLIQQLAMLAFEYALVKHDRRSPADRAIFH